MTDRFVGIGGNDGNSGLTWALRKLTLNGAEDTPVVAGDTVYVGPGVYRELLTCDVSGTGGNLITYIGDVTGENTDKVGGHVRLTGSDNDQTSARAQCINGNGQDYRTFSGFSMDMPSSRAIQTTGSTNWIVEDCNFHITDNSNAIVWFDGDLSDITVRRCFFNGIGFSGIGLQFNDGAALRDDTNCLVENCIFHGAGEGIATQRIGGITIKNCLFYSCIRSVRLYVDLTAGQTVDVNNCILSGSQFALHALVADHLVEDYNTFYGNDNDRNNVAVGGNSQTYPALHDPPLLFDGIQFPQIHGELSEWSQVARIAGTGEATDDLFGITRPTTSSKKSWGPVQLMEGQRETTTKRTGTASINLADAGDHQIFVPVDAVEMTISVYVYREADYTGTLPRMIVRQPGVADDVTTDTAAVSQWNELTTTLTPSADTDYVVVILRSLNTAAATNFDVFFDDLTVT